MACRSSFCTGLSKSTTSKHKSVTFLQYPTQIAQMLPPVTARINIAYFGKISARAGAEKKLPAQARTAVPLAYFFYYNS